MIQALDLYDKAAGSHDPDLTVHAEVAQDLLLKVMSCAAALDCPCIVSCYLWVAQTAGVTNMLLAHAQAHFTPSSLAPVQVSIPWTQLPYSAERLLITARGKGEVCCSEERDWL